MTFMAVTTLGRVPSKEHLRVYAVHWYNKFGKHVVEGFRNGNELGSVLDDWQLRLQCPQHVYSGTYVEPLVINDRCLKLGNGFPKATEDRREFVEWFQSRPPRADAPRLKGFIEGALELLVRHCGCRRPKLKSPINGFAVVLQLVGPAEWAVGLEV